LLKVSWSGGGSIMVEAIFFIFSWSLPTDIISAVPPSARPRLPNVPTPYWDRGVAGAR
jgi:hypothetical protein